MARPVRIAVLGADGRMGRALVRAVLAATPRAVLAAASERPGHVSVGKDAGVLAGVERAGVEITGELPARGVADVWIDFTTASVTESVATTAAAHGVGAGRRYDRAWARTRAPRSTSRRCASRSSTPPTTRSASTSC